MSREKDTTCLAEGGSRVLRQRLTQCDIGKTPKKCQPEGQIPERGGRIWISGLYLGVGAKGPACSRELLGKPNPLIQQQTKLLYEHYGSEDQELVCVIACLIPVIRNRVSVGDRLLKWLEKFICS